MSRMLAFKWCYVDPRHPWIFPCAGGYDETMGRFSDVSQSLLGMENDSFFAD